MMSGKRVLWLAGLLGSFVFVQLDYLGLWKVEADPKSSVIFALNEEESLALYLLRKPNPHYDDVVEEDGEKVPKQKPSKQKLDKPEEAEKISEERPEKESKDRALKEPHLCERDELLQGSWEEGAPEPPYVTPTQHLRCENWMSWDWKTKSCEFTPWNTELACSLLQDAQVLMVGDSLTWEQTSSLMQLLGQSTHQGYQHQSRELETTVLQSACGVQIGYRRDERLARLDEILQDYHPTVLILNRGAHYTEDAELLEALQRTWKTVQAWLNRCDAFGQQCHFFWRTTAPGHPGCGNFTRPVNDRDQMEALIQDPNNYNAETLKYHWYDFGRQNDMVLKSLTAVPHRVIDAYALNLLRPDQHRSHQGDCLHNCYPGKMDVYNQLLLHYLRMDRTMEHVDDQSKLAQRHGWKDIPDTEYLPEIWQAAKKKRLHK